MSHPENVRVHRQTLGCTDRPVRHSVSAKSQTVLAACVLPPSVPSCTVHPGRHRSFAPFAGATPARCATVITVDVSFVVDNAVCPSAAKAALCRAAVEQELPVVWESKVPKPASHRLCLQEAVPDAAQAWQAVRQREHRGWQGRRCSLAWAASS